MSTTDPDVGTDGSEFGYRYSGDDGNGFDPAVLNDGGWDGQPAPRPPITLDGVVTAVGGRRPEDFPPLDNQPVPGTEPTGGIRRVLGLPGRFLLRLINVLPEDCPRGERTKFYLMAATVLLNAGAAAYTVPTGLSAAYPGLHGTARLGLALIGAGVVGVMDALIVGYWPSPAKHLVNPPLEAPPPLPGPLRRLGAFVPRLVFTGIMVFGLGLLLTLSANMGVINKQIALDAIKDHNIAVAAAQALDDKTIKADTAELKTVHAKLVTAKAQQRADENRAACELYGKPRVPDCTPNAGNGPVYRHFQNAVTGSDQQQIDSLQSQIGSLNQEIQKARTDKLNQQSGKGVAKAAAEPTGLAAVRAAWDQYARLHGFSWIDRHLMDLLVLAIDIVPLGMKLLGGVSSYERRIWVREWEEAVAAAYRRETGQGRLVALRDLYTGLAGKWRDTRLRKAEAWLDADAGNPGEMPAIPPTPPRSPGPPSPGPPSPGPPSPGPPSPGRSSRFRFPFRPPRAQPSPDNSATQPLPWPPYPGPPRSPVPRIPDGGDPILAGRDASVGDVVTLPRGQYKLLAAINAHATCNTDSFIAAQIRPPGQVTLVPGDVPVRAVKFTRNDSVPTEVELEFVNRFPPGGTLLRADIKPTARRRRLVSESHYYPRSDVLHYLYGQPRAKQPRVTVRQVLDIMLSVNDAHRRIWEEGYLHNDTRLRNIIMAGALEDGREDLFLLSPRGVREDQTMLCDWGSMTRIGDRVDVAASVLESDPAVIRVLMGADAPQGPDGSAVSYASDQYSTFACAYQLLTGCVSPTESLLLYQYRNDPHTLAELEKVSYQELAYTALDGWPGALAEDPLPVRDLNRDVPPALADLVDAGVRANPLERTPRVLGLNPPLSAGEAASAFRDAVSRVEAGLVSAELDLVLPSRHHLYPWRLDAPVGWPPAVLDYIERHWPEYGS